MASVREKFSAILRRSHEQGKAISLYHCADGDGARFEVGYVASIGDRSFTLSCLNARGEYDGTSVIRLDDIEVLEQGDPYTRKIQLLNEYQGSVFRTKPVGIAETFEGQLALAVNNHLVVTAEDSHGHRFTGFVSENAEDFFAIELISSYGAPEGEAVIQKSAVTKLEVDRRDEQARGFLNRYHYDLKKLLE